MIVFNIKGIDHELYNAIDKTELFLEIFRLHQGDENAFRLSKEEVAMLNEQTSEMEAVTIEEEVLVEMFEECLHTDTGALGMKDILAHIGSDGTFIQYNQGRIKGALTKLGYLQKRANGKRPFNIKKKATW